MGEGEMEPIEPVTSVVGCGPQSGRETQPRGYVLVAFVERTHSSQKTVLRIATIAQWITR